MAEDAARELPNLPLEDALQLVWLYAERGSPKYERAALAGTGLLTEQNEGACQRTLTGRRTCPYRAPAIVEKC